MIRGTHVYDLIKSVTATHNVSDFGFLYLLFQTFLCVGMAIAEYKGGIDSGGETSFMTNNDSYSGKKTHPGLALCLSLLNQGGQR